MEEVEVKNQSANDVQNLRRIISQSPVAMSISRGKDHVVELANDRMYELWGKTPEEVLNKPVFESMPEARGQGFEDILDNILKTGIPFSASEIPIQLNRKGKLELIYLNLVYQPLLDDNGRIAGVMQVATEVTDYVSARKNLEESESKYKSLFQTMDQGFCVFEMMFDQNDKPVDYRFLEINPVFETQTGLKDVVGKNVTELVPNLEQHWFDLYGNVAKTGESVHFEQGSATMGRWFDVHAFRTGDPLARRVALLFTDISERKLADERTQEIVAQRTKELADANAELNRSNHQLEEFANAASHDLKEPVRKIQFFTERLLTQIKGELSPEQSHSFNRIINAAERMKTLIDDLLLFSHVSQRPIELETVNLNETLAGVIEDLELDIEQKKATIEYDDLPVVQGYGRQLQQMLQNLISNSLKYSKQDLPPKIKIQSAVTDREGKSYNCISIEDNGIGFEQEYAEKIFQIFIRLHEKHAYGGSGVGLSIVKKIVENHHGFIDARSEQGVGSTFTVCLPK